MNGKKNRYLVFACLQLLSICTYAQRRKKTKIIWNKDSVLNWADFKVVNHEPTGINVGGFVTIIAAITSTQIYCIPGNCVNDSVPITCYCIFDKGSSWAIKVDETPTSLVHEQKHFDITEIYTRRLRKALINKKFRYNHFYGQFRRIYDKTLKDWNKEEGIYDKETDFQNNIEQQKLWDIKIADELKALDAYSDIHLTVRLRHFLFF